MLRRWHCLGKAWCRIFGDRLPHFGDKGLGQATALCPNPVYCFTVTISALSDVIPVVLAVPFVEAEQEAVEANLVGSQELVRIAAQVVAHLYRCYWNPDVYCTISAIQPQSLVPTVGSANPRRARGP